MKKISLIFLSLVFVFAVGCSADDPDFGAEFQAAVAGKSGTGTIFGMDAVITFNDSGSIATITGVFTVDIKLTFTSASSATAAIYQDHSVDAQTAQI